MTFSKESSEIELVKGQIFFLEKILEPLFSSLVVIFPGCKAFTKNLRDNQRYYLEESKRLEKRQEQTAQQQQTLQLEQPAQNSDNPTVSKEEGLSNDLKSKISFQNLSTGKVSTPNAEDEGTQSPSQNENPQSSSGVPPRGRAKLFEKTLGALDDAGDPSPAYNSLSPNHRFPGKISVSPHRTESPTRSAFRFAWRKKKTTTSKEEI